MKNISLTVLCVLCVFTAQLNAVTRSVSPGEDIQAAVSFVASLGGGTVYLTSGTHTLSSSIQMKSNVTLEGAGVSTRLELPIDATYAMIVDDGTEPCVNMTVRNMLLDGNIPESKVSHDPNYSDPQGSCLGIYFDAYTEATYHTNVVIENVEIHNTVDACHIKGVDGGYWDNVFFHHNGIFYWPGHNSYLRRVKNYTVLNSRFEDSYNGSGVNCSWSENLQFHNCEVLRSTGRGIRNAASDGFLVHDCVIMDCGDSGIIANSEDNTHVTNCDFRRNCVSGCANQGIYASGSATGVAYDNNAYNNGTDYSLGGLFGFGNISDPGQACTTSDSCLDGVSAFMTIEAEGFCDQSGITTATCSEGGLNVGNINNGDWSAYYDVDFGSGADEFHVRVASDNVGGNIEIRLDSTTGTLLGTCPVTNTGGWQNWVTNTVGISEVSGVHDLYLVFTGGSSYLFNVNWFTFSAPQETPDYSFPIIEAEDYYDQLGISTATCSEGGLNIGNINNGDWCAYYGVDFGSGVDEFYARVASSNVGGNIEIRLDSTTGTLIGACPVTNTGGWQKWVTNTTSVSGVSGVHDLYLVFTGGSSYLFNVNWFTFSGTAPDITPPAAPTGLTATAGDGAVSLDWADNAESDLMHYDVYRSTTSGSGYVSIHSGQTTSDYIDNTAVNGTTYYYVVTATDDSSNESGYSNEDSATPQAPNQPPSFTVDPINEIDATEDAAYSSTIADDASDPESDPMTFSKVSGPAWLGVAADGTLSGTPDNDDVGLNVFTVQVDATGGSDTATLNITVINTNDAPMFTVDPITGSDATENAAYSDTIAGSATDVDAGDTLTYSKVSGPAWLSVASDGTLSGTPAAGDVGANVFTVEASDGNGGTDTATLNITVIAAPSAPAAPSGLSATAITTTQIDISWTDNASNETGFKIERSARNNSSFAQIATVGADVTSYSDTTVRKGTTYFYRVRATNADGDSAYSNEASATTPRK